MVSVSKRDVLHILEPRWTICQTKEVTWQAHRRWKCRTDLSSADGFSEKQIKMVFSSQSRLKCLHLNIKTFMERGTEITCSLQTQHKWFTKLRSPHSRLSRGGVAVYIQTQHWGKMEKNFWAAAMPGFWAIRRVWVFTLRGEGAAPIMELWLKAVAALCQCVMRFLQLDYFIRPGRVPWRKLEVAGGSWR